jgi:hypothetical protein
MRVPPAPRIELRYAGTQGMPSGRRMPRYRRPSLAGGTSVVAGTTADHGWLSGEPADGRAGPDLEVWMPGPAEKRRYHRKPARSSRKRQRGRPRRWHPARHWRSPDAGPLDRGREQAVPEERILPQPDRPELFYGGSVVFGFLSFFVVMAGPARLFCFRQGPGAFATLDRQQLPCQYVWL